MVIVPVATAYVDANFKESQFRRIRIGQPVELTSDYYGGDVVYRGKVIGIPREYCMDGMPEEIEALWQNGAQMLRDAGATMDDIGKPVNYARALKGVDVGGLITVSDDRIYVSLRGKGQVNVGALAARFGGGGHHNAAGCTISYRDPQDVPQSLAEAKSQLITACQEVMASASRVGSRA